MFKHYLEKAAGSDILGMISLMIFFVVFTFIIIWVIRLKKKYIKDMSELPLDKSDESDSIQKENKHTGNEK